MPGIMHDGRTEGGTSCRGYVRYGAYAHPGPADKAESKRAALQCIIGRRDRGLREIVQGVALIRLLLMTEDFVQ